MHPVQLRRPIQLIEQRITSSCSFQPIILKENLSLLLPAIEKINKLNPYQSSQAPTLTKIYFNSGTALPLEQICSSLKQLFDTTDPNQLLQNIFEEGVERSDKGLNGYARANWSWRSNLAALAKLLVAKPSMIMEEGKDPFPFRVFASEGIWTGLGMISDKYQNPSIGCRVAYFDATLGTDSIENIRKNLQNLSPGESLLCRVSNGVLTDGFFFTKNGKGKLLSIRTTGSMEMHPNLSVALSYLEAESPIASDYLPLIHDGDCTAYTETAIYFIMKAAEIRGCTVREIIEGLRNKTMTIDNINSITMPDWASRCGITNRVTCIRLLAALKKSLKEAVNKLYDEKETKKNFWTTAIDEQLPFSKKIFTEAFVEDRSFDASSKSAPSSTEMSIPPLRSMKKYFIPLLLCTGLILLLFYIDLKRRAISREELPR